MRSYFKVGFLRAMHATKIGANGRIEDAIDVRRNQDQIAYTLGLAVLQSGKA